MLETKTPQDFIHESLLLIQAHPATTRTTTTYSSASTVPGAPTALTPNASKIIKKRRTPTLKLKTFDPASGATIIFKTDKAADIGRVFAALGKVGRGMAGLTVDEKEPEKAEETPAGVSTPAEASAGTLTPVPAAKEGGGGGKGKKKKGKR